MKAMILEETGRPLKLIERDTRKPDPGQVFVRVNAGAVFRTDLHVVDGESQETQTTDRARP
jgi:propanol-preferring alcohol dehydrogenase